MIAEKTSLKSLVVKAAKAAKVTRAINHKLRMKLLEYLIDHPGTNVTKLYVHFRLEQSVASQHLAILRKEGLVTTDREGKEIRYSVNQDKLNEVEKYCDLIIK